MKQNATLFQTLCCTLFEKKENITMNKDLERLEIKISYLEKINAELNEVVIEQSKEINKLSYKLEEMVKKVNQLIELSGEERVNRKPPHY